MVDTPGSVVFLVAGRTGGPIMPVLAIADNLAGVEPVIIGVKGGFEELIAKQNNYTIVYLPQAKQNIQNTGVVAWYWRVLDVVRSLRIIAQLAWSIVLACIALLKHRPKMIITAGSFLGVPLVYATKITKLLGVRPKIVVHQQDVVPGKSNLYIAKHADILTVASAATKALSQSYQHAEVIPNPISVDRFSPNVIKEIKNSITKSDPNLAEFCSRADLPLLFVFGGGSGSEYLNKWITDWGQDICKSFRVLHLTGAIYSDSTSKISNPNYLTREYLVESQSYVLQQADIVISRAGMGTITELLYLNKPAFLVPMPNSHQKENAYAVQEYFGIWEHQDVYYQGKQLKPEWITQLLDWKQVTAKLKKQNNNETTKRLDSYYQKLQHLLD
jgi:UDP-N-acetylglucosamine--N-acetylmuramyl-(pentapeptide) pyrophosphoryl-undecaprenol N-acetylglucosamine transferase